MDSVRIDSIQYYINSYRLGDTYPILTINNFEKLINVRYPPLANVGAFDTTILVKSIKETDDSYDINLFYGIDILDGRFSIKLERIPIGYTNYNKPNGVLVKKPVFEIRSKDLNINKIFLTSDACKTTDKFLEFVYISLQDKLPNNIPF